MHNYTGLNKWDYALGGFAGHHVLDIAQGNFGSFNYDDPRTPEREGFGDNIGLNLLTNTLGAPFKFYGDLFTDQGENDRIGGTKDVTPQEVKTIEAPQEVETIAPQETKNAPIKEYTDGEQTEISNLESKITSFKKGISDEESENNFYMKMDSLYKNLPDGSFLKKYMIKMGYVLPE